MKTILKNSIPFILIILAILTLATSCNSDENENPLPIQNDFTKNFGNEVNRDFIGKIVDKNGNPVENVSIKVGGELASTDENGVFKIENANVYEKFAYITAKKSGFIEGSRSLVPTNGTNQVSIMLLEENIVGTVESGTESQVSLPDGTTLKFDGNFKDENGNNYTENVTVIMNHITGSDENLHKKMPAMLYGESTDHQERLLKSYGMVYIELKGSNGEKISLKNGHKAILTLPNDPLNNNAPNSLQPYFLNAQQGYWVDTTTPIINNGNYDFEIPDLNGNIWVDFDLESIIPARVCMTIVSEQTGEVLKGFYVSILSNEYDEIISGKTDENGKVCLIVPKNKEIRIFFARCDYWDNNTLLPLYVGTISAGTVDLGTLYTDILTKKIEGLLLTCNGNAVTDGYVIFNHYGEEIVQQINNGFFKIDVFGCINQDEPDEFTLVGYDNINHQHTNTYADFIYDYGNSFIYFMACESIPEYITYKIDNNQSITYTNIQTNSNSNYFTISGYGIDSVTEYIQISGDNTTLGLYNSPNFDLVEFWDRSYDTPTNIQFTLVHYGAYITEYIDINFSGTYTDTNGTVKNITGTAHVKRDN